MPVQKLLAKIHIAKKELGLTDEVYRQILSDVCRPLRGPEAGVPSAKDLDNGQALRLIRYFKDKGWQPKSKTKKYDELGKRDVYAAHPAQLRLIEVLWHEIYVGNNEKLHLRQFVFRVAKVMDLRFLEKDQAYNVIEALKVMNRRRKDESKTRVEGSAHSGV